MSIKYLDKSQSTPQEVLLAGTPQTDQILNPSSKNAIANKTVYNALSEKVSKTVNDLVNYYTKSDVYNKQEIRELIGAIETLTMEVVNALPSSDISTTTIYLLKQTGSSNYDEYVYINNEWVKIGTTQIDLSGYVTTSQLNQAIADFLTETEINLLLLAKQDKNLSSSVTIGSETVGTVEDAISEVADVIPSTVSASNKLATKGDIVNIEIDDSLSSTSENPVQNKVLKSALDAKQSSTLSSAIGGETTVEGVLNATDAALSNYINFAGAKNMLPCFLGNRLQYGIDFVLNDDGSIIMNGTSTGNPAYYAFAGENNGIANSPLIYKLTEVGLSKFLSFKVKILDTAISGVGLRIYFYDRNGNIIPNPNTSTNYINCSTSVTIDFGAGYYGEAEYVAFMLAVSKDTVLEDAVVYPLIYELNEYTRNSAYFPWAMTNRDLTRDGLKHTSWTDISKVGAVNFLENNAVTTVDSTAGLTYTVNADKSVTVSATSGEYPFTVLANSNLILYEADGTEPYVGKQIKISGCPKGGSDAYHIQAYRANSVDGSTGTIKEYGNGVIFDWLNDGSGIKAKVSVVLRKDLEMEGPLEFYPMITLTNYNGDYAPYAKTNRELTRLYKDVSFTGTSVVLDDITTLVNLFVDEDDATYYGNFIRVGKNAGYYTLTKYADSVNSFIVGIIITGTLGYLIHWVNGNLSVNELLKRTSVTKTSVAPFRVYKNGRTANVSTIDGSSISDISLQATTWATQVRDLGVIDSTMGTDYVMAPVMYQVGNNWHTGVARIFYTGRVDLWSPVAITGAFIPYLNVTLAIT